MKIIGNMIPQEWATSTFVVLCGATTIIWSGLLIIVGASTGVLPRGWVRQGVDTDLAAAMAVMILVAAVWMTVVLVRMWREIRTPGDGADQQRADS